MRLIIAGSRSFNDRQLMQYEILERFRKFVDDKTLEIVSGTARGADQMGEGFAHDQGLKVHRYPAEWDKYGKSAGYKRNEVMAQNADTLIAFWDGQSKGTKHMIDLAKRYGLRVEVVMFDG